MIAALPTRGITPSSRRLAPLKDRIASTPAITSDEDAFIRLAVERQLQSSGYFPLLQVRCSVQDGVVMLNGSVPSYYMKQQAQTIVLNLGFIERFENHCEVQDRPHDPPRHLAVAVSNKMKAVDQTYAGTSR
jgi:osmotically-inducible protein OsmY